MFQKLYCLNKLFLWSQFFCKFSAFKRTFFFSLSMSKRIWTQNTISKRFSAFLFPIYLLNLSQPFVFHVRVRYPIILSIKRPRKRGMGEFHQFFKIRRELIKNHDETCHFLCRYWCQSSCQKVQCVLFIIDCLRLRSFKINSI